MIPSNFKIEILNLLSKGLRPYEIAEKLKLNKNSTYSYIRSNLGYNSSRTYNIDKPDYFQTINSYMKAYWLGFICADGYLLNNPSKVIGIQITESDKIILEKFKKYIGSNIPLRNIKSRIFKINNKNYISKSCVRFHLGNKQMYDNLINLEITTNKSKTLTDIMKNIPYKYRDSFIIGYFDGDGSIILLKGKIKINTNKFYPSYSTHCTMRGTKDLLESFKTHLNINTSVIYNKTYILNINSKKDIIRFLKCYNNLNFFLIKKFDKLINRLSHPSYNKFMQVQTISSPFPYKEN